MTKAKAQLKTQDKDIEIARERLTELTRDEEK